MKADTKLPLAALIPQPSSLLRHFTRILCCVFNGWVLIGYLFSEITYIYGDTLLRTSFPSRLHIRQDLAGFVTSTLHHNCKHFYKINVVPQVVMATSEPPPPPPHSARASGLAQHLTVSGVRTTAPNGSILWVVKKT